MEAGVYELNQDSTGKEKDKIYYCVWPVELPDEPLFPEEPEKTTVKRCPNCSFVDDYTAKEELCHKCKKKLPK